MPELADRLRILREIEQTRKQPGRQPSVIEVQDRAREIVDDRLRSLPELMDRYEVMERVFCGAHGVGYCARDRRTSRIVCLKVLVDAPPASEHQRVRFMSAVDAAASLRHPNIAAVYEGGMVRERVVVVTEFVEGLPVDDYVMLHDLQAEDIVRLVITVCRGIDYAHQNGLIHGNLIPSNILVDLDEEPRVLGFGSLENVVFLDADRVPSRDLAPAESLGYMAPEVCERVADVRSDVYTLGAVLFYLMTELFPYAVPMDEGVPSTWHSRTSREPMRLREALALGQPRRRLRRLREKDLEAVLLKTLAKEPEHRYRSAADLADELERCLARKPVEARGDERWHVLMRAVSSTARHAAARFVVPVCIAIATAAVAILIVRGASSDLSAFSAITSWMMAAILAVEFAMVIAEGRSARGKRDG